MGHPGIVFLVGLTLPVAGLLLPRQSLQEPGALLN